MSPSALIALTCLLAQSNPVTNGGFEQLDDHGFPVDWSAVGTTVTVSTDAHSGQNALRFERTGGPDAPAEVGLNRAWQPDSGEQGAMLAERKGGIRYWYKLVSASPSAQISFQIIPMSARPMEDTGDNRAFRRIPNEGAGDGQWHEARLAYNFTNPKAKWVHVGVRITGGAAVLLLDDVSYVEHVGPILQVDKVHVYPDPQSKGGRALLTATISNMGDEPTGPAQVSVSTPTGIRATPPQTVGPLPPDGTQAVRCTLTGRLTAGVVRVAAESLGESGSGTVRLAPKPEIRWFLLSPAVAAPGATVTAGAKIVNRGTAFVESLSATLSGLSGLKLVGPASHATGPLAPGGSAIIHWQMTAAPKPCEAAVTCSVEAAGPPVPAELTVTDAVTRPAVRLAGGLWIRRGSDRAIGELRAPNGKVLAMLPHLGRVNIALPRGGTQVLMPQYGPVMRVWSRRGRRHVSPTPQIQRGRRVRRARIRGVWRVRRIHGRLRKVRVRIRTASTAGMIAFARDKAGRTWSFGLAAQAISPRSTRLTLTAGCLQAATILSFEGPTLLAGSSSAQRDAIFPGLEWLVADEVSSSDLDIAADHPDRQRFVPHPNKVTIPVMAVRTPSGTVGLLWDTHDRWDRVHDRPQPVFASPDRLGGTASHRMGLMAPNDLTSLPENGRIAKPGMAMAAGKGLGLTATLYADTTATDSLAALDEWFRLYKPEPPLPAPRGTDQRQIAWSMQVYLKTLWLSAQEGWLPFQGGPSIWRAPRFGADFAYDLLQACRILPYDRDAPAWRNRLAEVKSRIPRPAAEDLGLDGGDPVTTTGNLAFQASQLAATQAPDGSWGFNANLQDTGVNKGADYHELGTDGEVEVGTCARNAYEILLYARLSGDPTAYRSGVKALERMSQFGVPRAAQVWEVPVHTPDILAAADAVDAYLEAYRFTEAEGKPEGRWLAEAKRWARAGLPFVYVWNAPGKPWMRFGSIPVFGSTWMQGSWFGNIVQWNGLRYAYSLLKLYPLDSKAQWGGLSWRDIAVGLTRACMYQQSTKPANLGLWPDSYHTITDVRSGWDFAPRQILKNVYTILGRPEEPDTIGVRSPGGSVARVTSRAPGISASWTTAGLHIQVPARPGDPAQVMVAGISKPQGLVTAAGVDATSRYDAMRHLLGITLSKPGSVLLSGVVPQSGQAMPATTRTIDFRFDRDESGWNAASDLEPLYVANGALHLHTTGGDPYIIRPVLQIPPGVRTIMVRIRGGGDGAGQLFWSTATSPSFDEPKSLHFTFPTDGSWHEVSIPVGDHPLWRGQTITSLRLDPGSAPNVDLDIAWIRGR